ncbi:MAG: DUF1624 domain-containing protein [Candidatus Hydrogenedentes bacterium]|nr:DUF1624 domain-containing protein [Candidatus Hydrogenedentota bacterium]
MPVTTLKPEDRITAIDQIRGYAIFGMLLVNASGFFHLKQLTEQLSHHRNVFTYADTIAPLFVFVVGMGMRLSWLKRAEKAGHSETRWAMAKRFGLLVLIAFALYAGWLWDALMDIGLAGLLALFLIDKKPAVRAAFAFIYLGIYQAFVHFTAYGPWIMRAEGHRSIGGESTPLWVQLIPQHGELFGVALNGGPLGPLSWCMMLLFGSIAYDLLRTGDEKKFMGAWAGLGVGLCALGYLLSVEWPGVKQEWAISAYYMTAPFPLWSTGLCFLTLLAFYLICDKIGFKIPTFAALGMNPLFLYIVQALALDVMGNFKPESLSLPVGLAGFCVFYAAIALLAWWLQRKSIYIKI